MLAEAEFAGDASVGEPFGYEGYDLLLARGQEAVAAVVDDAEGGDLADEVEEETDLLGTGPDLAVLNGVDAFAEFAHGGVGEAEDAADAGAEGVDYDVARVALA